MEFENLLKKNKGAVERYIFFRISDRQDAEDILQETYITAFEKFDLLKNKECFKSWIINIAKNKCTDFFRKSKKHIETEDKDINQIAFSQSLYGICEASDVCDAIDKLKKVNKEILYFYYFCNLSQNEIAKRLNIPLGTVKSRLHNAKKNFKKEYPYPPKNLKGENKMKLPEIMPDYKIKQLDKEPFPVKWEEIMGWLIIPKLNEKISWAMYDFPDKKRGEYVEMEVTGKAQIHGIDGVEISAKEYSPAECNKIDGQNICERKFIAQLTDTHCRILAESHMQNGINKLHTFLDGDEFLKNWGFGEDNCGKQTNIVQKHIIKRNKNRIESENCEYCLDVTGRYSVIIGNKEFDTICIMDIESYDKGIVTEQYIDRNGRTVLWRRFNCDDWAFERYNHKWSELLPDNEQIIVNGKVYVHWYDCISDYIYS